MQFEADKTIREIAGQRNDNELLAITSDELIAKEAHYYRTYTKFYQKKQLGTEGDGEFSNAWELLIDLFENPKVEDAKIYRAYAKVIHERRT